MISERKIHNLKEKQALLDQLQEEKEALRTENHNLKEKQALLDQLQEEKEALRTENLNLKEKQALLDQLQEEKEALRTENLNLKEKQALLDQLQEEKEAFRTENQKLIEGLNSQTRKTERDRVALDVVQKEYKFLKRELHKIRDEKEKLECDYTKTKTESKRELRNLNKVQSDNAKLKKKIDDVKKAHKALEDDSKKQLEAKDQEKRQLEEQLEAVTKAGENLAVVGSMVQEGRRFDKLLISILDDKTHQDNTHTTNPLSMEVMKVFAVSLQKRLELIESHRSKTTEKPFIVQFLDEFLANPNRSWYSLIQFPHWADGQMDAAARLVDQSPRPCPTTTTAESLYHGSTSRVGTDPEESQQSTVVIAVDDSPPETRRQKRPRVSLDSE